MKIKNTVPVLALALTIGMAAMGLAVDSQGNTSNANSNPSPYGDSSPTLQSITGTVQNVDTVNRTALIKDANGNLQTVKVDNSTEISRAGSTTALADLKPGDVVTVRSSASTM